MSDKIYVRDAVEVDHAPAYSPFSKVVLIAGEDSNGNQLIYESGTDTGQTLELEIPWATQAMADNILASIGGYAYQPFYATDAILDPAAEIGDGITVGGVYSTIIAQDFAFNALSATNLSAPDDGELEHEYPYKAGETRKVERRIKKVETELTVGLDSITASVQNHEAALGQTVRLAADGLTITNAQGSTLTIDGGQLKANSVTATQIDVSTLHVGSGGIAVDGGAITFASLDSSTQSAINNRGISSSEATTLINSRLVSSPTIAGGEFCDLQQQAFLKMIPYSQTDGYKLVFCTPLHDETDPLLTIVANDAGSGALGVYTDFQVGGDTFIRAYPDYNGSGARCRLTGDWTEVMGDISFYGEINLDSYSYGSSLPSSGSEGQLFFVVT